MSFDRDIKAIFGTKADEFTDHHKNLLKRVWDCGRREGDYRAQGRLKRFFNSVTLDKERVTEEMPRGRTGLPPQQMEELEGFWRTSATKGAQHASTWSSRRSSSICPSKRCSTSTRAPAAATCPR